ncbi:hypothetical protein [Roseobacter sp. N2S]|uniref:hypothetical protein n=1 Tax=Roseobacter sp. N2S TaxID=2663844 RepID=UPI00285AD5D2|nr:hypothetical protein [Roseobacter sp. N2S]MDR6267576.1 hypothetical protein [Roseobacter sp. N2S]
MDISQALDCNNFRFTPQSDKKRLLISVNPDLKTDFGHFLNYEKRIRNACAEAEIDHVCLSHKTCQISYDWLLPTFSQDSGHFSLLRRDALNREEKIANQFLNELANGLKKVSEWEQYNEVGVFYYCGSSKLAVALSEVPHNKIAPITINAFWDFLEDTACDPERYCGLKFDREISFLAMSQLHRNEILDQTGFMFDFIPNPSPLESDAQAVELLTGKSYQDSKTVSSTVFFPGLMSKGKGDDTTLRFIRHYLDKKPNFELRVRDRTQQIPQDLKSGIIIEEGDFDDQGIRDLYFSSDIAVLPYEKDIFKVRTSGAIVDCLMYGVIPIVLSGSWLAHICEKYNFGYVAQSTEPEVLFLAIKTIMKETHEFKMRQWRAAICYLSENSWDALLNCVFQPDIVSGKSEQTVFVKSLLAGSNRLVRNGEYEKATFLYEVLSQNVPLKMYRDNIALCERLNQLEKFREPTL